MPMTADFCIVRYEDGTITVAMAPATAVGGWNVQFRMQKRFGDAPPVLLKSVSSGYNGASGITVLNSGDGVFQIAMNSADTSGLEFGNYAYGVNRLNPDVPLVDGYLLLKPSVG